MIRACHKVFFGQVSVLVQDMEKKKKEKKQKTYQQYIFYKVIVIIILIVVLLAITIFAIHAGSSGISVWDVIKTSAPSGRAACV